MKRQVFILFLSVSPVVTFSQVNSVNLQIAVEKQPYGFPQPRPFSGVGIFSLFRGDAKLEGASCPDKSNEAGKVSCKISCKKNSRDLMVVRVRPPSDQDSLAGWVTPSHQDIQMEGCSITPSSVTMRYEDAKYALNKLLQTQYFAEARELGSTSSGSTSTMNGSAGQLWLELAKRPKFAAKVDATTNTEEGRVALAGLYRIASEGVKAPDLSSGNLSPEELKQYEALSKWQVVSKNALLSSKLKATLPTDTFMRLKIEPTSDLSVYRANLNEADRLLTRLQGKTPEQFKLFDDVKTLKSLSAVGKDAGATATIIDSWK